MRPDRICVKCKLKIKGMVMNNFYKPGTAITLKVLGVGLTIKT